VVEYFKERWATAWIMACVEAWWVSVKDPKSLTSIYVPSLLLHEC